MTMNALTVSRATTLIHALINSANLDPEAEAEDCMAVFEDFSWERHPDANQARFDQLLEAGQNGEMSTNDLEEFMSLVADKEDNHLYYFICQAHDFVNRAQGESEVEEYRCVALSTAHLSLRDKESLDVAIVKRDTMVMGRDTGYFIKLYANDSNENYRHGYTESIKDIIAWAVKRGYRMIEFDADADVVEGFAEYE